MQHLQGKKIQLKNIEWNKKLENKLKKQLGDNKLSEVFQDLANYLSITDTRLFNDLVLLQSRFNSSFESQVLGLMSQPDYSVNSTQIISALTKLIDTVGNPKEHIEEYRKAIEHFKNKY